MAYPTPKTRVNFKNKYGDSFTSWLYLKFPEQIKTPIEIKYDNNFVRLGNTAYEKRGLDVVSQRDVSVSFTNISEYDLGYDLFINAGIAFFREDGPYYMEDLVTNKRFRVSLEDVKIKEDKGYEKRKGDIQFNFNIIDSFPESLLETTTSGSLDSNNSFEIELPSYTSETPFSITLANSTASNTDFYLELTNRDIIGNIRITEIGYVSGTSIKIDSLRGTCVLLPENINIKKSILAGTFFLLRKGTNTIYYKSLTGIPVDYTVSYRVRTAI